MVTENAEGYKKEILVGILATVFFAAVGVYIPILGILASFLWAVPITIITAVYGLRSGLLIVLVSVAALAFLVIPAYAVTAGIQFGSIGLVVGYLIRKGYSSQIVIAGGAAAAVVVTGIIFVLPFLMNSAGSDAAGSFIGDSDEIIEIWTNTGLIEILEDRGVDQEEIEDAVNKAAEWVARTLPSIVIVTAAGSAFIDYIVSRRFLLNRNIELPDFPCFKDWRIPWYIIWGVIVGLGAALIGDFFGVNKMLIIGENILYIYFPVGLIIGMAVAVSFITRIKSWVIKFILGVIAFLYLPVTVVLLVLIGVFDPLLDFRKRLIKKKEE